MESEVAGVVQSDEGTGASSAGAEAPAENQAVEGNQVQEPEGAGEAQQQEPLTPRKIRELRGKYFTVRHIPLEVCGHKMDTINEPRHRNCENCFWQWMNFHPQLVQSVDEAWREHGKEFIVKLRGKWFAHQFARYMATVGHLKQEEDAIFRKQATKKIETQKILSQKQEENFESQSKEFSKESTSQDGIHQELEKSQS